MLKSLLRSAPRERDARSVGPSFGRYLCGEDES